MGVTIHFEGGLKSVEAFKEVIAIAVKFASDNGFEYSMIQEDNKLLERVRNEENWDYRGPTNGILIEASGACDPINLEFDKDFYLQEYCKTQFAGVEIHKLICGLFKSIEPFFSQLQIFDEGEYWETADISLLETHFEQTFEAIEMAKKENGTLHGPFKVNGRIIDLMS